jgi:hypothetical protein
MQTGPDPRGTVRFRESIMRVLHIVARPFGYLAFVISLAALSAAAWLLGEKNELGFFTGRLAKAMWRYPEITRRGVQMAWLAWVTLLIVALSPVDPLPTRWDEVALVGLAVAALWRRLFADRQVER